MELIETVGANTAEADTNTDGVINEPVNTVGARTATVILSVDGVSVSSVCVADAGNEAATESVAGRFTTAGAGA